MKLKNILAIFLFFLLVSCNEKEENNEKVSSICTPDYITNVSHIKYAFPGGEKYNNECIDPTQMFPLDRECASRYVETGNAQAALDIANWYEAGRTKEDMNVAYDWLLKAAELGSPDAHISLGIIACSRGESSIRSKASYDTNEANDHFIKASELGEGLYDVEIYKSLCSKPQWVNGNVTLDFMLNFNNVKYAPINKRDNNLNFLKSFISKSYSDKNILKSECTKYENILNSADDFCIFNLAKFFGEDPAYFYEAAKAWPENIIKSTCHLNLEAKW